MLLLHEYSRVAPFAGVESRALDAARAALLGQGFEIRESRPDRIRAVSVGMRSTKQPPLLGATEIAIEIQGRELRLRAELGGVRWMRRFLVLFPLAMAAFFAIVLGIIFGPRVLWMVPLPLAPWIVLSPLLSRSIRNRTVRALDGLFASILACA